MRVTIIQDDVLAGTGAHLFFIDWSFCLLFAFLKFRLMLQKAFDGTLHFFGVLEFHESLRWMHL